MSKRVVQTHKAPAPFQGAPYSQAIVHGDLVFVAGQVGVDPETNQVVEGGIEAQTEQAMKNVKQLLEEQGARLGDICKIVIYLTDPRYREAVYRVVGKWLKGVYPVSTGLVIQALARPEWVVEVDVFAVIPESRLKSLPEPDEDLQWKETADRKDAKSRLKKSGQKRKKAK